MVLAQTNWAQHRRGVEVFVGPLPHGPIAHHERLTITQQSGPSVHGLITWSTHPERRWEVDGRYDGQLLQLYYYPSKAAKDTDFLDHGCYLLKRKHDSSFIGYSIAHGLYEDNDAEGLSIAHHELHRA
jgi:hypothetical protein